MESTKSSSLRINVKNIFALWFLIRLWVILSGFKLIPYAQAEFLFSDVRLYDWWAGNILDGHFPINDPMWQYPPLAAVIFAAGYAIAPQTVGFVLLALLADLALQHSLVKHGKENLLPGKLWLIAPLAMGPIFLGRFDVFPTLLACLALLTFQRTTSAGAYLAIGTLLKVWPGLGLLAVPKKYFAKTVGAFGITVVSVLGLLHFWWPDNLNFLQGQKSRGLQIESVGALPYMWWNAAQGTVNTNFQYGAIEVVAAGTAIVSTIITFLFVIFLVWILRQRLAGNLEHVSPAAVMLLIVLMSMLTSRVLSPQYNLWVLGLLAVVSLNPLPHFKQIAQLLLISSFCGQLLYPWLYLNFQQGGLVSTVVHTIRIATLMAATVLLWRAISSRDQDLDQPASLPID